MPRAFLTLLASGTLIATTQAATVATLDFSDNATWSVTVQPFSSAVAGTSGVTGGGAGLTVSKASGTGAVLVTATLLGLIDTTSFENLSLTFTQSVTSTLEWDVSTFGNNSDGLRISSTDGISFDATGNPGAGFETALNNGQTWTPALAGSFSQDLQFDPAVDNSSISNLIIQFQINAAAETITLTGFEIEGDAIAPIPEPSRALVALLGLTSLLAVRRRRTA